MITTLSHSNPARSPKPLRQTLPTVPSSESIGTSEVVRKSAMTTQTPIGVPVLKKTSSYSVPRERAGQSIAPQLPTIHSVVAGNQWSAEEARAAAKKYYYSLARSPALTCARELHANHICAAIRTSIISLNHYIYSCREPMHVEMATMLQVTRLHTQGRPCADRRKSEDNLISNPLFTNFVRPCCAELVGTAFVVIFSALYHFLLLS